MSGHIVVQRLLTQARQRFASDLLLCGHNVLFVALCLHTWCERQLQYDAVLEQVPSILNWYGGRE